MAMEWLAILQSSCASRTSSRMSVSPYRHSRRRGSVTDVSTTSRAHLCRHNRTLRDAVPNAVVELYFSEVSGSMLPLATWTHVLRTTSCCRAYQDSTFVAHVGGYDVCSIWFSIFKSLRRPIISYRWQAIGHWQHEYLYQHMAATAATTSLCSSTTRSMNSYWARASSIEPQRSLHTSPASRPTNVTLIFWNGRHDITPRSNTNTIQCASASLSHARSVGMPSHSPPNGYQRALLWVI
jgi:hypothetical protein